MVPPKLTVVPHRDEAEEAREDAARAEPAADASEVLAHEGWDVTFRDAAHSEYSSHGTISPPLDTKPRFIRRASCVAFLACYPKN